MTQAITANETLPAITKPKRQVPTIEFLSVPYTDAEIVTKADEMARYEMEKQALEEQLEAIKLDFKSKIEALQNNIKKRSREISKRTHYENVECVYLLESPRPSEKTLVRLDTGEQVRIVPMDTRDYQDPLPMALKTDDPVDRTELYALTPDKEKANGNGSGNGTEPIH